MQTQHRVDTSNYIMDKHYIKSKTNYRQAPEENTIMQTQHRVYTSNYIMDKHYIKSKTNYKQALEDNTIMQTSKQVNKQTTIITIISLT
jgi:predicted nucleic acid-binding protein